MPSWTHLKFGSDAIYGRYFVIFMHCTFWTDDNFIKAKSWPFTIFVSSVKSRQIILKSVFCKKINTSNLVEAKICTKLPHWIRAETKGNFEQIFVSTNFFYVQCADLVLLSLYYIANSLDSRGGAIHFRTLHKIWNISIKSSFQSYENNSVRCILSIIRYLDFGNLK